MRLVTINSSKLKDYYQDKEMLHKASKRPCALIVQLTYKGKRYDFAVPLRSNIPIGIPQSQFFALPPRKTTKPHHHHGLHYIKMFPVRRSWTLKYHYSQSTQAALIKSIVDKNEKQIISECKTYLKEYEQGNIPLYATDIDMLINIMNSQTF